ncbi:MAG: hypothetical protein LUD19_05825 [Clostridia bacterium]|nr:hypothetical protein [Clostridia bacterium]
MEFTLINNTNNNYRVRDITNKKFYKVKKHGSVVITSYAPQVDLRVFNPCFYSILKVLHLVGFYFIFFIPWIFDMDLWGMIPEKLNFESLWFGYRTELKADGGGTFIMQYSNVVKKRKRTTFAEPTFISYEGMGDCPHRQSSTADIIFEIIVVFIEIGLYCVVIKGIVDLVKFIVSVV